MTTRYDFMIKLLYILSMVLFLAFREYLPR